MTDGDQQVTILMGVYSGAEVLPAQLASIADQTHEDWSLVCSDDGPDDGGPAQIRAFAQEQRQNVHLSRGPGAGFSANYMAMIRELPSDIGMVSFADQDDVWMPDKLARGVAMLRDVPEGTPALYCARRMLWDPNRDSRQPTAPYLRAPSFRNALIENIAPGNTVVLNAAAARLARAAARRTGAVFAHDWWLYLLITGAGGVVLADPGPPCLLYRQHGANVIGGGEGARAQVRRKWQVLRGAFGERMRGNLEAMQAVSDLLTPEARAQVRTFAEARDAGVLSRMAGLARVAPYRQTRLASCGFWGAALLGRV